jgi:exodeoxyribonuclease-5
MLNDEQQSAIATMEAFLSSAEDFFLLIGPAGTGKTFTMKELVRRVKGRMIFTAPTNKATKVLREVFYNEDLGDAYEPECRTIFSLLGLQMKTTGEVKELAHPEDPVQLSRYKAVVVDEASMINSNLWKYIKETARDQKIKFIFMGDPAQLPPVGETASPVWGIEKASTLTKVMRHDNQILALATNLRKVVDHPAPSLALFSDNENGEGVWRLPLYSFEEHIAAEAEAGNFSAVGKVKAIAWRNVTVDKLNVLIRRKIFSEPGDFFPGDRIIMMEPAKSFDGDIVATTDAEGTIERSQEAYHPMYGEFKCYRLVVLMDEGSPVTLWVLHPASAVAYHKKVAALADYAKANRRLWKDYWAFRESFHSIRYGYAITAHRAQGSTYDKVYVNTADILANRNRGEAFRCLYVACTRPRKQLVLT